MRHRPSRIHVASVMHVCSRCVNIDTSIVSTASMPLTRDQRTIKTLSAVSLDDDDEAIYFYSFWLVRMLTNLVRLHNCHRRDATERTDRTEMTTCLPSSRLIDASCEITHNLCTNNKMQSKYSSFDSEWTWFDVGLNPAAIGAAYCTPSPP